MVSKPIICLVTVMSVALFPFSETSAKSYWKRGMAIGAGAGAVALGLPLGISAAATKCNSGDSDLQVCGGKWGAILGIADAAGGALIGMGIGAGIGSAIKVKEDTAIVPVFSIDDESMVCGLGISRQF